MKIAQVAPLIESVPPRLYGGTERVVAYLTDELVRRGHDVTLFASGDSRTAANLVGCSPQALRLDPAVRDPLPHIVLQLEKVRRRAHEFDVLHFHLDLLHFPIFRPLAARTVTTLHGRLDLPDLPGFYREFGDMPVVSISEDQRRPLPFANWIGTVHHGLPRSITRFYSQPRGRYLAFLGRISQEKRPDRAIDIAKRVGVELKIAAKVDAADARYFESEIRPLLDHPLIEYVGEIGEADKPEFLGNALALLFPVDWPEPFGLVMIEAMACGTPVIAYRCGSVPEVVEHGVNGFIVDDQESAARAVHQVEALDRARVRACFEQRFTVERMADDYLELYRALAHARGNSQPAARAEHGSGALAWS
jgi:glycosyltransferase involved in cell wall biosynthesis